jgi:hypothetical protein
LISTVLAISAAYVVMGVLLLVIVLTARLAWRVKAAIILITSLFFILVFFSTRDLLGWPGGGQLPARFQLLWARIVEPDRKSDNKGAVFLWVEEIDGNNIPSGLPRSYRLPYSRPLADRSLAARDQIMEGNAQLGTAEELASEQRTDSQQDPDRTLQAGGRVEPGLANVELDPALQSAQRIEFAPMVLPLLPPKTP